MLSAKEIRRKFLDYFVANSHSEVSSAPLVPKDDATLLFTNAGMVQFKKLFLGEEKRAYKRATTSQKCLRVSGKHNDLENVGRTARHHTFFEMLGNFSFGDYFKKDAIKFAWEFITVELNLPKDRLYVSVYKDDDEAFALWQEVTGISAERIYRLGDKDNFWAMGDTGPCGPCSEIYFDQGEDMKCGDNCEIGKCDCDRFLEIWNLVFMQYFQPEKGDRVSLPSPSIDTGMGLERIAAICQNKRSNYDTDLFQAIIQYASQLANVTYSFSLPDTNDTDTALRVIADHARSAAFLIADGILPSNEGRGYVLRRLIRRALRFATLMGVTEAFLYQIVGKVIEVMGEDYPELKEREAFICRAVKEEEERFALTLGKGLIMLEDELDSIAKENKKQVSGEIAFTLYDTYGFPLDIVNDIAEKRGFSVDEAKFNVLMKEQKERSRNVQKAQGLLGDNADEFNKAFKAMADNGLNSNFVGYNDLVVNDKVQVVLDENANTVESLNAGEKGFIVSFNTPFYAASGGQVSDNGIIKAKNGSANVVDVLKPGQNLIIHQVEVSSGQISSNDEIELEVTSEVRLATTRNHTATHLLHSALRTVLGEHVKQAGSLVTPERLRFDFSHIAALSADEIAKVEYEVNRMILASSPVCAEEMDQKSATEKGAMALFGEKYGDIVRVVSIGGDSVELCGGTHLQNSGQIGTMLIISEAGIAAGVRRIEALTGYNALKYNQENRSELNIINAALKTRTGETLSRIDGLQKEVKTLRKDLEKALAKAATGGGGTNVMDKLEKINDVNVLAIDLGELNVKAMREIMDDIRSKLSSGVACIVARDGEKVNMIIAVTKDLHGKYKAPDLIKPVAEIIGGSGGGRPDQAQAGGTKAESIGQAIAKLKELV